MVIRPCSLQGRSDPKKKIYALLGLIPAGRHEITVDHELSNFDLYKQVLKSTLKFEARSLVNDTLVRVFELDLCLALNVSPVDATVIFERQKFLN